MNIFKKTINTIYRFKKANLGGNKMKSKSLIIVSIIVAILCIGTISLATNDVKNGIHDATDTAVDGAKNLTEDVRNGVGAVENVVEDGAKNIGNAISDGARDVGNAVSDGANDMGRADTDNGGYTATRTTAADLTNTNNMNSTLWTWIIIAIAAVVIIGLVWYYAAQHNNDEH